MPHYHALPQLAGRSEPVSLVAWSARVSDRPHHGRRRGAPPCGRRGAARAARAAADVAAALSATGKGLYEQSPAATGAGLGAVAGTCEALADAFDDVPELRAAAAQLRTGAGRLRAGGAVLAGDPEQPKKKKPRRW